MQQPEEAGQPAVDIEAERNRSRSLAEQVVALRKIKSSKYYLYVKILKYSFYLTWFIYDIGE